MDKRPIGVFDSGLGGLTAVRQLRKVLPGEDIIFFGDTGRVPYGPRGRETIIRYAQQDINFLLTKNVKYLVAACGTVSSNYPAWKVTGLPVPYSGVLRATANTAAAATRNGKIGIIGTAATIRSGAYEKLLSSICSGFTFTSRPCPLFVPLVENGFVGDNDPVTKLVIEKYLTDVRDAGVDTLILGCTHYPLLKKMIGDFMGDNVVLVDPGKMTALAVAEELKQLDLLNGRSEGGTAQFYVSDAPDGFAQLSQMFLGKYSEGSVTQIAIENY